ncbi:MAG TPA: ferritin [bacterium]
MIPKRVRDEMNLQIKLELESYYLYLSMVAWFHEQNLDGMAHWMRCQAHEEMIHAMKFFDHIIERGGTVELVDLKQGKTTWSSPLEAWKDAYAHEQFVSERIRTITKAVREESDFNAEPICAWFNNEQIEEETSTQKGAASIEMVGDNRQGLLMLDREMGTRVFTAGSPLDPAAYNLAK